MTKIKRKRICGIPIVGAEDILNNRYLRFLKGWLIAHHLWQFNVQTVPLAILIGLFCAFIPIPFQMVVAAILSVLLRANIIIAVSLVWISNPLTMPILFYAGYRVGAWLFHNAHVVHFDPLTLENILHQLNQIWLPFYLGNMITGLALGLIGWCVAHLFFWLKKSCFSKLK